MSLHPNFPASPYAPLIPEQRWFPADETMRATAAEGGSPSQRYDFVFVDQTGFEKHTPKNFAALAASFTEYKA
ncbi:MAG: hypothetical protein ACYDH9_01005 [Limisphaerales bacterium]